jgi:hypothetical protein
MSRWLVTYEYRMNERLRAGNAIFMGRMAGPKTEMIDCDPVTWLTSDR